ncbi:MAG: SH3 domain-containing protein [Chloroflexi bacterium]|nr:SH3 domain-containing protein [Chloroflexota bacterium]
MGGLAILAVMIGGVILFISYRINSSRSSTTASVLTFIPTSILTTETPTSTSSPTAIFTPAATNSPSLTVSPISTFIPLPTLYAIAQATPDEILYAADGVLPHDQDNRIEAIGAYVLLANFVIEALFYNPYDASEYTWDYGFVFRHSSEDQYRLGIRSDKTWALIHYSIKDENFVYVSSGTISELNIKGGESNLLRLAVENTQALIYINDKLIAVVDGLIHQQPGDIQIASGLFDGDELYGATTEFENFWISSIGPTPTATFTPTPTLTSTPTPTPVALCTARVRINNLNMREGPSTFYRVLRVFNYGEHLTIIGQDSDNQSQTWLKVRRPSGQEGWVIGENRWWLDLSDCDNLILQ